MRLLPLLLVTGCFVEEKTIEPDFSCSGAPIPSIVPDRVRVDGQLLNLAADMPLPGVFVKGKAGNLEGTEVVSDENGRFTFSHDLPDSATQDSILARGADGSGLLQTRGYPGKVVFEDSFVELRMIGEQELLGLAQQAQVAIDLTKESFALIRVTDCNESGVPGGVIFDPVITLPPGLVVEAPAPELRIFYFEFLELSPNATQTDASGLALITGIPIDPAVPDPMNPPLTTVVINGTIGDVPLIENTVTPSRGTFVQTLARP